MIKYTVFSFSGKKVILLTASIVGFSVPDPRIVWTNIVLENGAEVALNGMSLKNAKETYEKALKDKDPNDSTNKCE